MEFSISFWIDAIALVSACWVWGQASWPAMAWRRRRDVTWMCSNDFRHELLAELHDFLGQFGSYPKFWTLTAFSSFWVVGCCFFVSFIYPFGFLHCCFEVDQELFSMCCWCEKPMRVFLPSDRWETWVEIIPKSATFRWVDRRYWADPPLNIFWTSLSGNLSDFYISS